MKQLKLTDLREGTVWMDAGGYIYLGKHRVGRVVGECYKTWRYADIEQWRGESQYFKIFQGFAISVSIMEFLEKLGFIRVMHMKYYGITQTVIYGIVFKKAIRSGHMYKHPAYDEQWVIPEKYWSKIHWKDKLRKRKLPIYKNVGEISNKSNQHKEPVEQQNQRYNHDYSSEKRVSDTPMGQG